MRPAGAKKKKIARVQRARAGHARDTTDLREAARPRTAGSAPDGPWKDTPCRKRDRYLSVARTVPWCIGCGMLGAPAKRPDGTATLLAIGKRGAGSGQRSVEQQVATGARGLHARHASGRTRWARYERTHLQAHWMGAPSKDVLCMYGEPVPVGSSRDPFVASGAERWVRTLRPGRHGVDARIQYLLRLKRSALVAL